ncbi:R3H domain-containing 4 isoform X2 [Micractinium conductrix]|uniref:R3H domain-containing 4 isoform X2 n=1 Tax=Micractinium conductrix TaxID=554055 RepID=A0A2P6V6E5_9CHLO|nr:R3H domain-containing 4 isoform X2 [Micractinium conductrix]|eukprot:PSC69651.1 R3H domain-containing 4 isoform X2 [Micractinium conductrix]
MPDGRPLTMALEQSALRPPRGGAPPKHRSGRAREPKEGWTKPLPRAATAAAAAATSDAATEAEAAEIYALSRVGARKQRRWLNDKLLRDMAGTLTASDMASLFKPVPFGEARPSLWEQAAAPEHAVLWDLFRSLEMDKQSRVLQKWEAHVRELQASPAAIRNPAVEAIAAWAQVSWKARQAMKRCSPSAVAAMEAPILAYVQDDGEGELVLDELEDGFHRLIAHGLAEYHSLSSHSRPLPGGGKVVVVRRRSVAGGPSAATATAGGSSGGAAAGGGDAAAGDAEADALVDVAEGVLVISFGHLEPSGQNFK